MRAFLRVAVFLAVLFGYGEARATIFYVPSTGTPTIQSAIDAAATYGDYVYVAPGTYNESIIFSGKNVYVKGTDGPDATILNGAGTNHPVVRTINGEIEKAVLDGFTVTGGNASVGGIECSGASATFMNLRVVDNYGDNAGGFALYNCGSHIENSIVAGNSSEFGSAGIAVQYGGHPVLRNVVISGNAGTTYNSVGALLLSGQSGPAVRTTVECISVTISGNRSDPVPVYLGTNSTLHLYNSIVWGNESTWDAGYSVAFNC